MANTLRALCLDQICEAQSGHPGLPLGLADFITVLFAEFLRFYSKDPWWDNRDRFILSPGHGSSLIYSLFYLTGYPDFSLDDLKSFRKTGSKCAGHPEYGLLQGIETSTGPLG